MRATLVLDGVRKAIVIKPKTRIKDAMAKAKVLPGTSIATINGVLAHPEEKVAEGDVVEIVGIVYGG